MAEGKITTNKWRTVSGVSATSTTGTILSLDVRECDNMVYVQFGFKNSSNVNEGANIAVGEINGITLYGVYQTPTYYGNLIAIVQMDSGHIIARMAKGTYSANDIYVASGYFMKP